MRRFRNCPNDQRVGLRVYVASADNLLALKISASRAHDLRHAVTLARVIGMTTVGALSELFSTYFPNHQADAVRDARLAAFIVELVKTLETEGGTNG